MFLHVSIPGVHSVSQIINHSLPNPLTSRISHVVPISKSSEHPWGKSPPCCWRPPQIDAHKAQKTCKVTTSFDAIPLVYSLSYSPISHFSSHGSSSSSPHPAPHLHLIFLSTSAQAYWHLYPHTPLLPLLLWGEWTCLPLSNHQSLLVPWILFLLGAVAPAVMPFLSYIIMSSSHRVLPIAI